MATSMGSMTRWRWVCVVVAASAASAAASIGALAGCNAVLGIDEAKLDPSLADSGQGGGDGAAGDASDAGSGVVNCDTYCADITKNCTGTNAEYISIDVCKAMCAHLEPGLPGEQSGDSLACRAYHAGVAAGDPSFHCRHAGPVGGGTCGDQPCNPFCLLDFALCGGQASPPYDGGELGCRQACDGVFRYDTSPDASDIPQSGNTLNCRVYHLEAAYDPSNPSALTTHCPHTATVSATCN